MRKKNVMCIAVILAIVFSFSVASAQTTPIDFTGFTGSGFSPSPSAGQLDSNIWRSTGFGTNVDFGATCTSGDCARGSSSGGVTTGGIYAFNVGGGNTILGVQPGGSDFTPGTITLVVTNNTGSTANNVYIAYDIWTFNDQARSNSLNFDWSLDDASYTSIAALDYATPGTADSSPSWQMVSRATTLTGINLADGASIYLRWTGDDVSGADNRDEYGIDDIEVRVGGPTALTTSNFIAKNDQTTQIIILFSSALLLSAGLFILRRRKTV